jgi:hypothetical protein
MANDVFKVAKINCRKFNFEFQPSHPPLSCRGAFIAPLPLYWTSFDERSIRLISFSSSHRYLRSDSVSSTNSIIILLLWNKSRLFVCYLSPSMLLRSDWLRLDFFPVFRSSSSFLTRSFSIITLASLRWDGVSRDFL